MKPNSLNVVLSTFTAILPFAVVGAIIVTAEPICAPEGVVDIGGDDDLVALYAHLNVFCCLVLFTGKLPMLLPIAASEEAGIST